MPTPTAPGIIPPDKIEIVFADHLQKPDVGATIVRRWFDQEGVDAVADVPNSSVALAINQIARDDNKVLLPSSSQSLELMGAQCTAHQIVVYRAPAEPGLTRLEVVAQQRDTTCAGEALITVTNELVAQFGESTASTQGLPGYTFERAPGGSWRSRFDTERNLIVVNNGHRNFVFASRGKTLKLRYLLRLYAKELVLRDFMGLPGDQLLQRMIELSLRAEEHL